MRKIFGLILSVILVLGIFSLVGCAGKDSYDFSDPPVDIQSKWFMNKEGLFCLELTVTNNSQKEIKYLKGNIFFKDTGQDGTIYQEFDYPGIRLYIYDINGIEVPGQKLSIKPQETFSFVVYKLWPKTITYQFDVSIYLTWIDFAGQDNWGAKNISGTEQEIAAFAPKIPVEPIIKQIS